MTKRGVLSALAGGLLQGCSPLSAFNTLTPNPLGARRAESGVAYGPLPRQKLDIYRPTGKQTGRPVLVFFYGGSWEEGDRADYAFAGRAFASRGFVTLVADYRVTGQAPYPAFLEDGAAAVAWAQAHAAEYGGDPQRVALAGHSAGAYIAAMLALDRHWLAAAGARPPQAWAGLSGPYDFLPLTPGAALRTFGRAGDPRSTQPITFADAQAPPAFLAHGEKDQLVKPRNTERLAQKLRDAGVRVETKLYPGAGHAELVLALAWPVSLKYPVLRDAAAFLHSVVG